MLQGCRRPALLCTPLRTQPGHLHLPKRRCCGSTAGAVPVILVQFQLNDAHKGGKEKARRAKFGSTEFTNLTSWAFIRSHVTPPASRERPPPAAVAESGKLSESDDTLAAGPIVAVHLAASAILHSEEWGLDGQPAVASTLIKRTKIALSWRGCCLCLFRIEHLRDLASPGHWAASPRIAATAP